MILVKANIHKMTNLACLQFAAFDGREDRYIAWARSARSHLRAMNLENTIQEGNQTSLQDKAKALNFLLHHLTENLQAEYLTEEDPLLLWKSLEERFFHQIDVLLPQAQQDWINLRFQDFKTVAEYNSALFKITSQLKYCGQEVTQKNMINKTLSTFHSSNIVLQQIYRERHFQKYSELISCLLVAEKNNELLLQNHQSRPTGSLPIPEANANTYKNDC